MCATVRTSTDNGAIKLDTELSQTLKTFKDFKPEGVTVFYGANISGTSPDVHLIFDVPVEKDSVEVRENFVRLANEILEELKNRILQKKGISLKTS